MKLVVAISCVLLAACSPAPIKFDAQAAGPTPANYKAVIAAYIKRSYFDPYSLRDVKISPPSQGRVTTTAGVFHIPVSDEQGWIVCVELNGKNRMGAYTGVNDKGYLLRNDVIVDADVECPSDTLATLLPWPEMDAK